MFDEVISERIKYYIYRLIDPRNGETFYVGKGRGNRVFEHARGNVGQDPSHHVSLKVNRIRLIMAERLDVAYVIHRHGIEQEAVAYQIEAAVIDSYPGLTNAAAGHGSSDYGPKHPSELIILYNAPVVTVRHRLLAVNVNRTIADRSYYDSARFCWILDPPRARNLEGVVAVKGGVIRAAFRPTEWLRATPENFPSLCREASTRLGFVGLEDKELSELYLGTRLPENKNFSQQGLCYLDPEKISRSNELTTNSQP